MVINTTLNAKQQKNLAFQQKQLSGQLSSRQATKIAQNNQAASIAKSTTINRYPSTQTPQTTQTTQVPKPQTPQQGKQYITGEYMPPRIAPDVSQTDLSGGDPAKLSTGLYNPDYVPTSESEVMNVSDPYMRQKLMANFYKSKGLEFDSSSISGSFEEETQKFLEGQKKEKTLLEQQIEDAKNEFKQKAAEDKSAINSQLGINREGTRSTGNEALAGQVKARLGKQVDQQIAALDQRKEALAKMQTDQQKSYLAGREDMIRSEQAAIAQAEAEITKAQNERRTQTMDIIGMLQKDNALGGLDEETLAYLQEGLPDAPPGLVNILSNAATRNLMNDQQKQKLEKQTSGINMMQQLATNGISLTPQMMVQMSQTTGLPVESLMAFNERAQSVMDDKTLDQTQKMQEIQKGAYELSREARGITNTQIQNFDYLQNMQRNGASDEEIAAFKKMIGANGLEDPMEYAKFQLTQAQIAYSQSQTAENYQALKEAESFLDYSTGTESGGYLPTASLEGIKSSFDKTGKLIINSKKPYQCGAFVNRFWGLGSGAAGGMGNSLESKRQLCDKTGYVKGEINVNNFTQLIKPGMAFVTSYAGTGHTGIVTKVYADGTYDTMEANIGDKNPNTPDPARPGHRSIKDGNFVGFASPPKGKFQEIAGGPQSGGGGGYAETVKQLMSEGMSLKDAKELAKDKTKKSLNEKETIPGQMSEKQIARADKWRNDFESLQTFKDFSDIKDKYNNFKSMIEAGPSGASDVSMVYSFMKALDPRSVVKQEEFDKAANTGNIFQGTWAKYNGMFSGESLPPEVRQQFMSLVTQSLKTKASSFRNDLNRYRNQAKSEGQLDEDMINNVIPDLTQDIPELSGEVKTQSKSNRFQKGQFGNAFSSIASKNVIDSYGDYYLEQDNPYYLVSDDQF